MTKITLSILLFIAAIQQCSNSESSATDVAAPEKHVASPLLGKGAAAIDCTRCKYIVPDRKHTTDGKELGIQPGDIICLDAKIKYGPLRFVNLTGTKEKPIIITNCGGPVILEVPSNMSFVMKTETSKHFRVTGSGDTQSPYGLKLTGGKLGLTLDYLSTEFEVDHLEVYNVGFAGIMAKTDPNCDDATIREKFTMTDVSFHNNYVHETGGEGFYIGNSFYAGGVKKDCGQRMPHAIHGVKIFDNIVKNSGWESIQLGSATKGAEVYNNRVENYGTKNKANQRGGIQLGEGTGGLCYNNLIYKGPGNGLIVLGYGDNVIFNNVIAYPGLMGVFCDERFTEGSGFKFINNTIIQPGTDGIRMYSEMVELNMIVNNLIVNPGAYDAYEAKGGRDGDDAFIYKLNGDVKIDMRNNYFTRSMDEVMFNLKDSLDFSLKQGSPARDAGADVSAFNVTFDFLNNKRPANGKFDIGAYEN